MAARATGFRMGNPVATLHRQPLTPALNGSGDALLSPSGGTPSIRIGVQPGCSYGEAFCAPAPGTAQYLVFRRFAALPAATRHAWLAANLTALRAGRVTLEQLP